jgi:hypothetical protein
MWSGASDCSRADRAAVVAELAVVVVLDHQAVTRPGGERGAALGRQRRAEADLMRGRDHDRVGRPELPEAGPALVHRQRHDPVPGGGDDLAVEPQARVLHRHRAAHHGRQQRQSLHVAAAQHDPLRHSSDAADAPEVRRQRRPQLDPPARIAEPQRGVRSLAQHAPLRRGPGRAGEARDVRATRSQVVARLARRGLARRLGGR